MMLLFCLPYAGGSELIYHNWNKFINERIEIHAITLKGRGKRFCEGFYQNLNEAVEDIYCQIHDKIQQEEYAIYGHSMGALLTYELYYKIINTSNRKPKHLFFSGRFSPNVKGNIIISHKMPDKEFMDRIVALGGIADEVLESKELLEFILPILKNDIRIVENYVYKERDEKIQCNISVLNGTEDNIDFYQKNSWKYLCDRDCKLYDLNGNHFFINNNINVEKIARIMEENLLNS
ncbi:thioesterase II family protein [Lysinibacillus sp. NPDC056185]|uniref:thioesterase II family protein n=1 Tax=Lysinibacillus sp. NPDC056185 TaxID=3345739 RepID=UPI0039F0FFAE